MLNSITGVFTENRQHTGDSHCLQCNPAQEINEKMNIRHYLWECELDASGSGWGPLVLFCDGDKVPQLQKNIWPTVHKEFPSSEVSQMMHISDIPTVLQFTFRITVFSTTSRMPSPSHVLCFFFDCLPHTTLNSLRMKHSVNTTIKICVKDTFSTFYS